MNTIQSHYSVINYTSFKDNYNVVLSSEKWTISVSSHLATQEVRLTDKEFKDSGFKKHSTEPKGC